MNYHLHTQNSKYFQNFFIQFCCWQKFLQWITSNIKNPEKKYRESIHRRHQAYKHKRTRAWEMPCAVRKYMGDARQKFKCTNWKPVWKVYDSGFTSQSIVPFSAIGEKLMNTGRMNTAAVVSITEKAWMNTSLAAFWSFVQFVFVGTKGVIWAKLKEKRPEHWPERSDADYIFKNIPQRKHRLEEITHCCS